MKKTRTLAISLLATLAVWLIFSWPLPRHVLSAIPYAARAASSPEQMLPGDHLQLLYHFWLASDMIRGGTPAFHNIYEFNTGNDATRLERGTYYVPFSLIYAVGERMAGRAFGWNLAGFVSLWLTFWLTWRLTRRYAPDDWSAAVAALPSLVFCYRWYSLMGGSPTGFAMIWIPAILLGLDIAVREARPAGGVLAGAGVFLAGTSDTHVFFFGVLVIAPWCLIAYAAEHGMRAVPWRKAVRIALALLPAAALTVASYALSFLTHESLSSSTMAGGRSIGEVLTFAPPWQGLFTWKISLFANQIYIGYALPLAILAGSVVVLWKAFRHGATPEERRRALTLFLCLLGALVIVLLALGPRGPGRGQFFRMVRRSIPPYTMIRQSAKVFSLLPSVTAVALALALSGWIRPAGRNARRAVALAILAVLIAAEPASRIRTGICGLHEEQEAYAAVAADAAARRVAPRALVVTLWPGDSHYASFYQYYASLYRIRLVNGYSPVVHRDYIEDVFKPMESVNQGWVTTDQLDRMRSWGVNYILVHEDLFPEKVSPFPVCFTIRNLMNNPWLKPMTRSESVWAFRILEAPEARPEIGAGWNLYCPARHWEAENAKLGGAPVMHDPDAGGGKAVRLVGDASVRVPDGLYAPAPNLRYLCRVRGTGTIRAEILRPDRTIPPVTRMVNSRHWTWIEARVPTLDEAAVVSLVLTGIGGQVDVDSILLAAGEWTIQLDPGQTVEMPAACFFHAGHMELSDDSVRLARGGLERVVFYGPKLPLEPGEYEFDVDMASSASPGETIGDLRLNRGEKDEFARVPLFAGQPARHRFTHPANLPVHLVIVHSGTSDLAIRKVTLRCVGALSQPEERTAVSGH